MVSELHFTAKIPTLFHKITFLLKYYFSYRQPVDYSCAVRVAANVVAAWRQAGEAVRFGRERGLLFDTQCRTSHTPACAKPLVRRRPFIFVFSYYS